MPWNSDSEPPPARPADNERPEPALPFYRCRVSGDLSPWRVVVGESDLHVYSEHPAGKEARECLTGLREAIQSAGTRHPAFMTSLEPVALPPQAPAPPLIVRDMLNAAEVAGTGPMAAVAGAIAEGLARHLAKTQGQVITENGGDIFLMSTQSRTCAIYAGDSPFSMNLGLVLRADQFPCALCTSSGTVGHSLSFGKADAAVVLASNGALADACATALANNIHSPADLESAVGDTLALPGVLGALAIAGDKLALQGDLEITRL